MNKEDRLKAIKYGRCVQNHSAFESLVVTIMHFDTQGLWLKLKSGELLCVFTDSGYHELESYIVNEKELGK